MNKTPVLLTSRISNIAIIGLQLWADGMLTPQQRQAFFVGGNFFESSNMKRINLFYLLLFAFAFPNLSFGQTYLEQNKKCSEILKDIPIGDSIFWVKLESRDSCLLGLKAPFFEVTTIDNEKFNIDSLKGKVVFINFWFTLCGACIAEMPYLNRLLSKFKKENILFLSFANEDSLKIKNFLHSIKFNFKVVPNGGSILVDNFKLFPAWPTTIIIDKDSKIRFIKLGKLDDKIDNHKKLIKQLLE